MIGVDTNILVRYFIQDDPKQTKQAVAIIENATEELFINLVVLCELVWVLEAAYKIPKKAISELLSKMLQTKNFEFQNKEIIWQALDDFMGNKADFADCLIGRINLANNCKKTVTFDHDLKNIKYFELAAGNY